MAKKKKDMWLHFCSYKYISIYYYGIKFISMDRALNVFGVLVSEQFSKDFFFFLVNVDLASFNAKGLGSI